MLGNTLSTNQVKDAAGVEVEFEFMSSNGRTTIFKQKNENPSLPYRLTVSHVEVGQGLKRRRRSLVRVDKTILSQVDNVTPVVCSSYHVSDTPVGALTSTTEAANALANVISFTASDGSDATIKFDGTGTGAVCLLQGSL